MNKVRCLAVILAGVLLSSCGKRSEPESNPGSHKESEREDIVHLDAEKRALANIKVEQVQSKRLRESITVPARIDFNQQRLAHIISRVAGRVEQVYAFVGDRVQANALLATIYSQGYLTAQSEFLQAEERLKQVQSRKDSLELSTARAIYESARRKVLVMGATENDLKEIGETHIPKTFLEIRSPLAGSVTEENEILGHFIDVGTVLFHVADLSNLWIIADIYEKDLSKIKTTLNASIEVAAYPNEKFEGHLTRVFDVLDEKTRTVKARVEVHNPLNKLKPQMFATVTLETGTLKDVTVVPSKALQTEGENQLVFVAVDDSPFGKRFVKLGRQQDNWVEIINGLKAGERIVTDGAFVVKSEFGKSGLGEE